MRKLYPPTEQPTDRPTELEVPLLERPPCIFLFNFNHLLLVMCRAPSAG